MRTYLIVGLVLLWTACSKKDTVFNETRQRDLYLISGKVFYTRTFSGAVPLTAAEKELTQNNFPNGGVQVKSVTDQKLNGVILSYPMEWASYAGDKIQASEEMKKPLNATFEIVKTEQGYKVTVQNMWFSNDWKHTSQENVVLEKYIVDEKRFRFRKDQNTLNIIQHLCQRLESLFYLTPGRTDDRF